MPRSPDVPERGLLVFRASRLEALLDPLRTLLDALPPEGLLTPHTLIAAHPGMRRWLLNALARRAGRRGIAANLEVSLPGQWLDRQAVLPASDPESQAAYAGPALRWRLLELLDADDLPRTAPQLARYLAGAGDRRRRWELAGLLGELYGRLLVYRPDWLQAWQSGADDTPEPTELAALWRALRTTIGHAHRSEHHAEFLRALRRLPANATPLHVFGVAHLPPRHLEALRAVATNRLVVFYLPDPCVEHWAGLRNDATRLRTLLEAPQGQDGEALYLGVEHPLLASLGRLGQQFGVLLAAADEQTVLDTRAGEDADPPPGSRDTLLGRLQDSIRRLQPGLLRADDGDDSAQRLRADASLRVHRCHSRLRELEVLRDALLQAFVEMPDLRPHEVAVLAPRMADYAPLLASVFGPPARADAPLPYHTADLPLAASHPLLAGFQRLVTLPQARITAADVLDLLALPALRRALGLNADDIDTAEYALRESGAAWGLDSAHRAAQGVPALAEHTLAWSLDRLCGAYVFGDDDGEPLLVDGILPAGRLGDGDGPVLGALHRLLAELAALREALQGEAPASAWISRFRGLLRRLFVVDPQDVAERNAAEALDALFGRLERSRLDAGCDPVLDGNEALAMLRDGLADMPQPAPYLPGGITFCGMVPQRALPFRLIAVLGLDDDAFPRVQHPPQFDPLPRHPRLGDRDVQRDDRYLFLETLMAARERLHLSWVGEGARDGRPRNPSAVLAELLDLLDAELPDSGRAWLVCHPLQPFAARADDGDPALRRFARRMVTLPPPPAEQIDPPTEPSRVFTVRQVEQWLRDPARELLRDRLHVRLDALDDDSLPEDEPLDARVDPRRVLWRQLLVAALESGAPVPEAPSELLRASGVLPPGHPGERAYAKQRQTAELLRLNTRSALPWLAPETPRTTLAVDLAFDDLVLRGELTGLYIDDHGTPWLVDWIARESSEVEAAARLRLLLRWMVLQLASNDDRATPRCRLICYDEPSPWVATLDTLATTSTHEKRRAALRARLQRLLDLYRQAPTQPLAYFPKLSGKLLATEAPDTSWFGGYQVSGERDYAPGYAQLLAGERRFWEAPDDAADSVADTIALLRQLLDIDALAAELRAP